MGKSQPSGPAGFEEVMPSVANAKGWHHLNRKHRRSHLARSQAGRPASVDDETVRVIPKRVRLKTQAANVAFARGVEKYGV